MGLVRIPPVAYTSRVVHMLSSGFLAGDIIGTVLLGARKASPNAGAVYAVAGALAILTGVLNTYLMTPKENMGKEDGTRWKMISHTILLFTALFFTPLWDKLAHESLGPKTKAGMVIALVCVSSYMRFYREAATKTKMKQT